MKGAKFCEIISKERKIDDYYKFCSQFMKNGILSNKYTVFELCEAKFYSC